MKSCLFCGEPVDEKSWDYLGNRMVYVCDRLKCEEECRDADRQAREEAALDAAEDGYQRYM